MIAVDRVLKDGLERLQDPVKYAISLNILYEHEKDAKTLLSIPVTCTRVSTRSDVQTNSSTLTRTTFLSH